MNLFTIKKAIRIYLHLISSIFYIVIGQFAFASEEVESFCFNSSTNINEVQHSLKYFLLPSEKILSRNNANDNCFEVVTSTDRRKLLEKILRKRYSLIEESGESGKFDDLVSKNCQIELKSSKKKNVNSKDLRIGPDGKLQAGSIEQNEVSTELLLLGLGKSGSLDIDGKTLYIECRGGHAGNYQLLFSYSEKEKMKISSEVNLKQGEILNIAQITNDLNNKRKTLGLGEFSIEENKGKENITYELLIK
jgi:hypothetical protein